MEKQRECAAEFLSLDVKCMCVAVSTPVMICTSSFRRVDFVDLTGCSCV